MLAIRDPLRAFDMDLAIALRCRTADVDEMKTAGELTTDQALVLLALQGV